MSLTVLVTSPTLPDVPPVCRSFQGLNNLLAAYPDKSAYAQVRTVSALRWIDTPKARQYPRQERAPSTRVDGALKKLCFEGVQRL